jgi:hypothetical protein
MGLRDVANGHPRGRSAPDVAYIHPRGPNTEAARIRPQGSRTPGCGPIAIPGAEHPAAADIEASRSNPHMLCAGGAGLHAGHAGEDFEDYREILFLQTHGARGG